MTSQSKADAEIVRQIYDCFLQEENRRGLLERLTREFRATYSVFMRQDRLTGLARIIAADVVPEERQRAYESYYARRTPTLNHWDALCAGDVFTDRDYDDSDSYLSSEIYNDFLRPLRADHFMCLQLWHSPTDDKSVVVRRSRQAGPFARSETARLQRLGQHLRNAERLGDELHSADVVKANLGALLERLGIAAFVSDRSGFIRYMTPLAEQRLRESRAFGITGGHLDLPHAGLDSRLRRAIRDCTDSLDDPRRPARCALRGSQGSSEEFAPAIFVSSLLWKDGGSSAHAAALVVLSEPNRSSERAATLAGVLAALFDLTPAQGRVAAALCEGHSLSEHAAEENISIHTARTLLKRVQEKTETHSQAELVSLLLRSSTVGYSR